MRRLIDRVMRARARQLAAVIAPLLPARGPVLDVGSGTGHNAAALRRLRTAVEFVEVDVVDISMVGAGPRLFDGHTIPYRDRRFGAATLVFVLHYADDPVGLLREAHRVSQGPLLLMQTICGGARSRPVLRLCEAFAGRVALAGARALGAVPAGPCALRPRAHWSSAELRALFARAGLRGRRVWRRRIAGVLPVAHELYQLQPAGGER